MHPARCAALRTLPIFESLAPAGLAAAAAVPSEAAAEPPTPADAASAGGELVSLEATRYLLLEPHPFFTPTAQQVWRPTQQLAHRAEVARMCMPPRLEAAAFAARRRAHPCLSRSSFVLSAVAALPASRRAERHAPSARATRRAEAARRRRLCDLPAASLLRAASVAPDRAARAHPLQLAPRTRRSDVRAARGTRPTLTRSAGSCRSTGPRCARMTSSSRRCARRPSCPWVIGCCARTRCSIRASTCSLTSLAASRCLPPSAGCGCRASVACCAPRAQRARIDTRRHTRRR